MPAGRPSLYRPEYVEQAEKLSLLGATNVQMADFFGVTPATFYSWQLEHPEFLEAVKVAKTQADTNVVRSLYQKALGYEYDSEKLFLSDGEVIRAKVREIVPPSDTACIFWLKNRQPAQWRDRITNEISGPDGGPVKFVTKSILDEGK